VTSVTVPVAARYEVYDPAAVRSAFWPVAFCPAAFPCRSRVARTLHVSPQYNRRVVTFSRSFPQTTQCRFPRRRIAE
jgi:hypothetical protein